MKAWIENNRVRDIAPGAPADHYHPDIAAHYSVEVPEGTQNGAELVEGTWVNPAPPTLPEPQEPPPPALEPRHITRLAFLSRFSDAEAIAIDLASQGATQQAAAMRRYQSKINAATYVDLDRADTRAGVQALELMGLISAGRGEVILDAAVQDTERFRG